MGLSSWLPRVVALGLGGVTGFFLLGPLVMADGPFAERMMGLAMAGAGLAVLSAALGWWSRAWSIGLWLVAPGVLVAFALSDTLRLSVLVAAAAVACSAAGGWAGARLRR